MRVVLQRVREARVEVAGQITGHIQQGLLVLVGIEAADTEDDAVWLTQKIVHMRIFADAQGVMNESLLQQNLDVLVVSQFTLHAQTKKGNRPSYIRAARPEHAIPLYEFFKNQLETALSKPVPSGLFGADMQVHLVNDGPVTIWVDSKSRE